MTIAREEIFGPVMSVFVFDEVEEVIKRANDSEYGLAASVWTESIKKDIILRVNCKPEPYGSMTLAWNWKQCRLAVIKNLASAEKWVENTAFPITLK